MGIVTKTGDLGTTGTLSGERVLKSSSLIELNGQIDEVKGGILVFHVPSDPVDPAQYPVVDHHHPGRDVVADRVQRHQHAQ